MKHLKQKFTEKIEFVKPLYKKVKPRKVSTKHSYVCVHIDNTAKLIGDGFQFNKNLFSKEKRAQNTTFNLPKSNYRCIENKSGKKFKKMIAIAEANVIKDNYTQSDEWEQHFNVHTMKHKLPDSWLRVCPASKLPHEGFLHILFRYFMCQLGLSTFLILWTIIWIFVINRFEEPYEAKVSKDFQREQNQLVINLATELRQITPLSPKWRNAIEARLDEERRMTLAAVGRGARLHPGHFWDAAGTFLFTVYVMTALGFGAPVPHTVWGRTASLVYAAIAIPVHIYLMVNMSTCVVIKSEKLARRIQRCLKAQNPNLNSNDIGADDSRFYKERKTSWGNLQLRLLCLLKIISVGRGVPAALILYYVLGVVAFGLARSKLTLECVMFPIEFTTSGGLEHVVNFVRILYGLYVEGAMVLLSCALASLRRRNNGVVDRVGDKYQLFIVEDTSTRLC